MLSYRKHYRKHQWQILFCTTLRVGGQAYDPGSANWMLQQRTLNLKGPNSNHREGGDNTPMVASRQKPPWEKSRQDSMCPVPGWQCCWWDPGRSPLLLTLPWSFQAQLSRLPISSMSYVVSFQEMPFLLKLVSDELKS